MKAKDFLQTMQNRNAIDAEKLMLAENDNRIKKLIEEEINKREVTGNQLEKTKSVIQTMLKVSVKLSKKHRDRKINFLEREIERNLAYLMSEEDFRVRIKFMDRNGEYFANLEITKGDRGVQTGDWHLPKSQNGRFIRQIISFSCMYSINKLRGSKVIFSDESLASADKQSLTDLKPLLDSLTEENFQIIMIEHKEELYKTLSRKEIHLQKDRVKGRVLIREEMIVDVDKSKETDSN